MVDNKVVKIVELENYQRRIPEEIIQRIERCKGIFDKMYVVFTDYTKREERRVEAIKEKKTPFFWDFPRYRNKNRGRTLFISSAIGRMNIAI